MSSGLFSSGWNVRDFTWKPQRLAKRHLKPAVWPLTTIKVYTVQNKVHHAGINASLSMWIGGEWSDWFRLTVFCIRMHHNSAGQSNIPKHRAQQTSGEVTIAKDQNGLYTYQLKISQIML